MTSVFHCPITGRCCYKGGSGRAKPGAGCNSVTDTSKTTSFSLALLSPPRSISFSLFISPLFSVSLTRAFFVVIVCVFFSSFYLVVVLCCSCFLVIHLCQGMQPSRPLDCSSAVTYLS